MNKQFKEDVDKGLSADNKSLPSKYFYDKKGDELFVKIMDLPEYYVTRAELEIFQLQSAQIIKALKLNPDVHFELIELGAGNGLKTKELLQQLEKERFRFDYIPVDISQNALDKLEADLEIEMPNVLVKKRQGDYFQVLESLKDSRQLKIILFLGSNIGNMSDQLASEFIYGLGANLRPGDKLLLGVDLIKSAAIVLPAYNDSKGITAAFNMNLLRRINNELGGNFILSNFEHKAEYIEDEGIARSFLISKIDQKVKINDLHKTVSFVKGEKIQTEISRKYNEQIILKIIKETDFKIIDKLSDSKNYFTNYVLERTVKND